MQVDLSTDRRPDLDRSALPVWPVAGQGRIAERASPGSGLLHRRVTATLHRDGAAASQTSSKTSRPATAQAAAGRLAVLGLSSGSPIRRRFCALPPIAAGLAASGRAILGTPLRLGQTVAVCWCARGSAGARRVRTRSGRVTGVSRGVGRRSSGHLGPPVSSAVAPDGVPAARATDRLVLRRGVDGRLLYVGGRSKPHG